MKRLTPIRLDDFTGGEASCFPISRMPSKYALLMQNCYINERGNISKIPGYIKLNTTPTGTVLQSGYEFRKTDGTIQILAAGGGHIYKLSGGELVSIKSGLDTSAKVYFSTMNNICIITNGVSGQQYKYDGTTVSALGGSPPNTSFKSHVHKGRVWMIERTNKMLATHSSLNNPEEYTGGTSGYIDFKYVLKEGDELVDMFTYVDLHVFVFKNHVAIYSGQTPSGVDADYQLVQLIKGVGAITTDVFQTLGTDAFILGRTGIKSLRQIVTTGSMTVEEMSKMISPTIMNEIAAGGSFYSSAHYPKFGWGLLLLHGNVWAYSYIWKAWSRIVGADIKGMFTGGDGTLYLCGEGYLYQFDSGYSFAGNNIEMEWQTAWLALSRTGDFVYPKMLEIMYYPAEVFSCDFSIIYDFSNISYESIVNITGLGGPSFDDVTDIDALNPWDAALSMSYRLPLFGRGRVASMKFRNVSATGPVEFANLNLWVKL
jgi:hypothetical protein